MVSTASGCTGSSARPGRPFTTKHGKDISMSSNSRAFVNQRDQQLIDGFKKNLASYPSLTVGSEKLPPADIVAKLQKRVDLAKATAAAFAAYKTALKTELDARDQSAGFVLALKRMVAAMFFDSASTLADFGLKPERRAQRKAAEKAAAAELAKATRAARHTAGKKQKQAIKGQKPSTTPAKPTA